MLFPIRESLINAPYQSKVKKMKKISTFIAMIAISTSSYANMIFDGDVSPSLIFGDGNANGGWTIFQNEQQGVELALRAKLRFNENGDPENTFNSNGDGTYTFDAVSAPTQDTFVGVWSFEWAINSNYNDSQSDFALNNLTYGFGISFNGMPLFSGYDFINSVNPINGEVLWDHATGDNTSTEATKEIAVDAADYATLIDTNNVAQNSQQIHWWAGLQAFDPTNAGTFTLSLAAFDAGNQVGAVSIDVITEAVDVSAPSAIAILLLGLGVVGYTRKNQPKYNA